MNRKKKISYLTYMDDIKLLTKNEKESETLRQPLRIHRLGIGMEFAIEKYIILITRKENDMRLKE